MTLTPIARRLAVTAGLAIAVLAAAGTILAASRWTETEAPLGDPPVSVQSLEQALDQERSRSVALEQELAALEGASGDLAGALDAARAQVAADATTAADLRAALDAAQAKLATLEAALQAASDAGPSTGTLASAGSGWSDDDDDDHDDRDHDDDDHHDDDHHDGHDDD